MSEPARSIAARRRGRRFKRWLSAATTYVLLGFAALIAVFPIAWGVSTSFKEQSQIAVFPPHWIPRPITIEHYVAVSGPISIYLANSLVVSLITIGVTVAVGLHGGYAAARSDFPLKRALLFLILSTMMVPGIAVLIPLYLMASQFKLFNTYAALVLIYAAWMAPMALWLLRGFFETVPRDLEDAARMDGCSKIGVLYRVVLPIIVPGIAAVAIVVFVYVWNEFIIALTMTTATEKRTVTVAIFYYVSSYGIEWGKLLASVSLALVPVLTAFIALQRGFISGLTAGGTRG
jgi:ABC-type glycerol-3-phosphate transport system permease component